jgi:hypothetical protein
MGASGYLKCPERVIYAHVTPVMMTEAASKMEAMGANIRKEERATEPDEIAGNGQ